MGNTSRAGGLGRREILSGLLEKNRSRTRAQTAFTMATVRMSKCASSRTQQRIKHRGILRAASTRRHLVTKASGNGSGTSVVEAKKERKASPLQKGGTLEGDKALGKDPAAATKAKNLGSDLSEAFADARWVNGTWDISQFSGADGNTDWDAVIDAEMERRRILEANPSPSSLKDKVLFDTSIIPWWAWVKRFHLPEAEKMNGRAAMVGYFSALVIDGLTGTGIWDQQNSGFGKLLLNVTVIAILVIRNTKDIKKFQGLFDEATFYDEQWNASWEGVERPEEDE